MIISSGDIFITLCFMKITPRITHKFSRKFRRNPRRCVRGAGNGKNSAKNGETKEKRKISALFSFVYSDNCLFLQQQIR